jgi:hypothetical protein
VLDIETGVQDTANLEVTMNLGGVDVNISTNTITIKLQDKRCYFKNKNAFKIYKGIFLCS